MRTKSLLGNAAFIVLGLILVFLPLSGYQEGIIILLCVNCIAAMGVSLLTGFTGIFTLGHAAYMALGAYTAAILTVRGGVHWVPAIVAGGVIAVLVAWLIGIPTLRLTGDYYAIASIGLGEAIRLILENWQSVTRGARGFPGIDSYTTREAAVAFFVILGILLFNLINSSLGRELKASRDDRVAASLMGFHTPRSRMKALLISAFCCGISGALLGGYMNFIQPSMFDMMKSTELTAVVVFGGLGSMSGTILGSAIITLVMEYFRDISQYRMLIYGALLVVIMVMRPEGLLGNREIWTFIPGLSVKSNGAKRRDK
jgi:branched-chain amino acid transport system permease protein